MYCDYDPDKITERLLLMIGEPYEHPDGCIKFVQRALWEFGVEIDGRPGLNDARLFVPVEKGELGTVIVWQTFSLITNLFHVGIMLDNRFALQCSVATNGVGRIEITREPWARAFRGFYKPKVLEKSRNYKKQKVEIKPKD